MGTITIAKVLKPQGVKGELKLEVYMDDLGFYKSLKQVIINNTTYDVVTCTVRQGFGYITLKGLVDRTEAENFRGKILKVTRDNGPQLQENEYLVEDMLGMKVVDDNGNYLGDVKDIEQYGAADVYVVYGRGGVFSFPFINALIVSVDNDTRTITVDSKVLSEVRV